MPAPLTFADREEVRLRAFDLSINGYSAGRIGQELGINHKTASALVREQIELNANDYAERRDAIMTVYEAQQLKAMAHSWDMANSKDCHQTARALHMKNYLDASTNIAKAKGLFVERTESTQTVHHIVSELSELWNKPLPPRQDVLEGEARLLESSDTVENVPETDKTGE